MTTAGEGVLGQGLYGWSEALIDGNAGAGIVAVSPALRSHTNQMIGLRPSAWRPMEARPNPVGGISGSIVDGRLLWRGGAGAILYRAFSGAVDAKGRYAPFVSFYEASAQTAALSLLTDLPEEAWLAPEQRTPSLRLSDFDLDQVAATELVSKEEVESAGEVISGGVLTEEGWCEIPPISLHAVEVLFSTLAADLECEITRSEDRPAQMRIRFSSYRVDGELGRSRSDRNLERLLERAVAVGGGSKAADVQSVAKVLLRKMRLSHEVGELKDGPKGALPERADWAEALAGEAPDLPYVMGVVARVQDVPTEKLASYWNAGKASGAVLCVLLLRELADPGTLAQLNVRLIPRRADLSSLSTLMEMARTEPGGIEGLTSIGIAGLSGSGQFRRLVVASLSARPGSLFDDVLPAWDLSPEQTREAIAEGYESWSGHRSLRKGEREALRSLFDRHLLGSWLHRLWL